MRSERLISTATAWFFKVGRTEEIVKLLKESGFTAFDLSITGDGGKGIARYVESEEYLQNARELRAYADAIGIRCNQTHAPFASARKGNEAYNAAMMPKLKRAIETSGVLGAKVCVVHPCNDYTPEENAEKVYLPLVETARRANVKIGVENMWNRDDEKHVFAKAACSSPENFLRHLELLPKDVFVANLDVGHAELRGMQTSACEMIEALGEYMQSVHLHDVNFFSDTHALPFTEKIRYEEVIDAMRKVGYPGDVTLECGVGYVSKFPKEVLPTAAKLMADVAAYIKKRLDE